MRRRSDWYAHHTGTCNVALPFRHTVGRAASRRQHRRSWQGEDVGRNPPATYAIRVTLMHPRSIPSPSSSPESHAAQWNASNGPGSARFAPAKVLRPCGAESTRSFCPGSSREVTFGCSSCRDALKEENKNGLVCICVPRLTSAGLPPRRADRRRRRVVVFCILRFVVRCDRASALHLCRCFV